MARRKVAKVTIALRDPLLAQMEEGYRELARQSRQLAESTFGVVSEMLERTTQWHDVADDQTRRDRRAGPRPTRQPRPG